MNNKFLILLAPLLFSLPASAQAPADSFAIFQKEASVTFLVNETGSGKLNQIMLAFASPETDIAMWQSPNHDVKLQCSRGRASLPEDCKYSCIFQFLRSSEVTVTASNMTSQVIVVEPQIVSPINLSLENKAHDLFKLELSGTLLKSESEKK